MKIIQIDGFRGLVTAAFVVVCLFAGFVVFPGYVAMNLWNTYLVNLCEFPVLNLFQGVLLWGMTAVSYAIIVKNNLALSFKNSSQLSDDEISSLVSRANVHKSMDIMKNFSKIEKMDLKNNKSLDVDKASLSRMSSPFSVNKIDSESDKVDDNTEVSSK